MKQLSYNLTVLVLFLFSLIGFHATAQSWSNVGSPGFSDGQAMYISMAIDRAGTPFVCYADFSDTADAVTVMKYSSGAWIPVGSPRFTAVYAHARIAFGPAGDPYVVFRVWYSGKLTVMRYDGTDWVTVGSAGFTPELAGDIDIVIDAAGTPYVSFMDGTMGSKVTVMKYDGSGWVPVGTPCFSSGYSSGVDLAVDSIGTPYVVFTDFASGRKAAVMKFNGSSWVSVGTLGFSSGGARLPSIAFGPDNLPYVSFADDDQRQSLTVMKYNGASWLNVGSAGFTADTIFSSTIAVDVSGAPYVAFQEWSFGKRRTQVMKYNGSSWAYAGTTGFPDRSLYHPAMALDPSGIPYIAFADSSLPYKASVKRFDAAVGIHDVASPAISLTAFPNPAHGSFTINVATVQNEKTTVIITNMLGRKVTELTIKTNTDSQIYLDQPGMYLISVPSLGAQSIKMLVW